MVVLSDRRFPNDRVTGTSRKPGRPRIDPTARSVDVHVSLPPRLYDQLSRLARDEEITIQNVIRRALAIVFLAETT